LLVYYIFTNNETGTKIGGHSKLKYENYEYFTEEFHGDELDLPTDEVMLSILKELLLTADEEMNTDVNDTG